MMKLIEKKYKGKERLSEITAYGGLLLCIIIFSILPPMYGENIWSVTKLATIMSDLIVLALLSVGAVFIYSLGNMDISVGKQVGLYSTIMVILGNRTGSLLPGIALALVIAVAIAVINGTTGEILRIHPIIPSLVMMMVLSGVSSISYNLLGSRNISLKEMDYSIFKSPWLMLLVLLIEVIVITYLFRYTKFGKIARAIGANHIVARQSGIPVLRYKAYSYMIFALTIVIASAFRMGYTGSASDSTGTGLEMNIMVALILGGMPLSGGMRSKVSCAVIGSLTYSLLNVGLPLIGIAPNMVFLIKAMIFVGVVLITSRKKEGVLPR